MPQEAAFKLVEAGARKQTDKYLPPAELPQIDDPKTAVPIGFDAAYHVIGKKQLELDDCEGGFIRRNQKVELRQHCNQSRGT